MKKFFLKTLLGCFLLFESCSNNFSQTDIKLQGEWKFVRKDFFGIEFAGSNIDYIIFKQDNFELSQDKFNDTFNSDYWQGPHLVSGKYKSDSSYIYFEGTAKDKNKDTGRYEKFKEKVRYEFKGDSLIIGMTNGLKEMNENYHIVPHVFIKK